MLRKLLIGGVLAVLAFALPGASAQTPPVATPATLMPGVTLETGVEFTTHGPIEIHVVRAPRPGGLYDVAPILSNDSILGLETVTAMQKRLAGQTTAVSVNGDLFATDGHPTGILVRGGVLDHPPVGDRSSAGFDAQGALRVERVRFVGDWRGTGQRRPLEGVNRTADPGNVVLFTPSWGASTPRAADAVDAVLAPFPAATPNVPLASTVVQLVPGGGTAIPSNGAVLQSRGVAIGQKLTAEAPVGTPVTVRPILQPSSWGAVKQAIGGGPILVRSGKAVFRTGEAFASSQLLPREGRSAVGQAADGTVLLVQVDGGRPGSSSGMSSFELALTMQRLGAVWAMGLGAGAVSELAFDGTLVSTPPGAERPVADALSVLYYGVYAPPPTASVFSPNGDGTGETEQLAYKLVRAATVHATLTGPDGVARSLDDGHRDPGTYPFAFTGVDASGAALPEGSWRWRIDATDDQGAASSAERTFSYDRTLGFERVSGASVSAQLTRSADVSLRVETSVGVAVRTIAAKAQPAGQLRLDWDGRTDGGAPAPAGRYVARLIAKSAVGTSELQALLVLRR